MMSPTDLHSTFAIRRAFVRSRRFFYLAAYLLAASGAVFAQGVSHCMKREGNFCTDCGIDVTTGIAIPNKTRTPLPACRDMKPGPARLTMETHAEPVIPGLWEVEFGLGSAVADSLRDWSRHDRRRNTCRRRDPGFAVRRAFVHTSRSRRQGDRRCAENIPAPSR